MTQILLELEIQDVIDLEIEIQPSLNIIPVNQPVSLIQAWASDVFGSGARRSGYDTGTVPGFSIENDYLYVCVQAGTGNEEGTGTSIWKKSIMFKT